MQVGLLDFLTSVLKQNQYISRKSMERHYILANPSRSKATSLERLLFFSNYVTT
jgi:hypothetical protein